MNTIDGLDALKKLFNNDADIIKHLLENSYFLHPDIVFEQTKEICHKLNNSVGVPVRYSHDNSKFCDENFNPIYFENKKEAVAFTKNNNNTLLHHDSKKRILIDNDGNYATKYAIKTYTGHWASAGQKSTITNYTIAHIWGTTHNPLFFLPMWNYCLIPAHISQLTDKCNETNVLVHGIKDILKAISIILYNPNKIMGCNVITEMPASSAMDKARELIKSNRINFLSKQN